MRIVIEASDAPDDAACWLRQVAESIAGGHTVRPVPPKTA